MNNAVRGPFYNAKNAGRLRFWALSPVALSETESRAHRRSQITSLRILISFGVSFFAVGVWPRSVWPVLVVRVYVCALRRRCVLARPPRRAGRPHASAPREPPAPLPGHTHGGPPRNCPQELLRSLRDAHIPRSSTRCQVLRAVIAGVLRHPSCNPLVQRSFQRPM